MVELEALERGDCKRLKEDGSGSVVDSTEIERGLNQPASKSAQLLGAPQPFTLHVFTMSGQCLVELEIRPPEVPRMEELAAEVGLAMNVSAGRVSLLHGTGKLPLSQDVSVLPRHGDDLLELHAIADELGARQLEMRPGRVTAVRLQGPTRLEVEFAPGEISEPHSLPLCYSHTVVVRSDIPKLLYSTQVDGGTDIEVSSMTLLATLPRCALQELLLLRPSVSIRTAAMMRPAEGGSRPVLIAFRESQFERCSVQNGKQHLCRLVGKLAAYWVLDCLALLMSAVVAIMELVAGSPLFGALLAATLWLPGFIWACRYQAYTFDRKFVGFGELMICPAGFASFCSGIVWLWVPLGLLAGTFVVSGWHFLGLMRVVCSRKEEVALPFDLEKLYLFELYKRDVRLFSDGLRFGLLAGVLALQQGSRNESLVALIATVLAGLPAFGRYQQWPSALEMLAGAEESQLLLDHVVFNAAICACQNGQQWQQVLVLLDDMHTAQLTPDVLCCTAAIDACAKRQKWQLALAQLHTMTDAAAPPDVVSCNTVLIACQLAAQWQQVLQMTSDMGTIRLHADILTMQSSATTYCDGGQYVHTLSALEPIAGMASVIPKKGTTSGPMAKMAMYLTFSWLLWLPNAAAWAGESDAPGIETARLYGNLNAYAYYFTDLLVGSPQSQLTSVIIDTGSHLLGFPCGGCDHCGNHLEPAIDVGKSQTAKWMPCTGKPFCDGCSENRCKYQEKYSEGSAISGHWFEDYVKLGDVFQENPPVKARMGCHDSENKLFFTQEANGIMGLAPKDGYQMPATANILQDLFRDKKHVDASLFSICLATWGGLLSVGGDNEKYHTAGVNWIPMGIKGYYSVRPKSMMVDDRLVAAMATDFGMAVVDTGTTLTYFPPAVFNNLIAAIDAYCALPDKCMAPRLEGHPHCWKFKSVTDQNEEMPAIRKAAFPTIKMKFRFTEESVEVHWRPETYLSKRVRVGELCYAFQPMEKVDQTILGISFLLHKDAIFDVSKQRLGLVDANCPPHYKIPTKLSLWGLIADPSWLLQSRLSISLPVLGVLFAAGFLLIAFRVSRMSSASHASRVASADSPFIE
ncbi:A39 [Symbiodinium microadriaticum]|nr:A39 [Symbiodinium microadriaticum]